MRFLFVLITDLLGRGRWPVTLLVTVVLNGCSVDQSRVTAEPADPTDPGVVTRSGVLVIIDPSRCQLPEGCGARARLMDAHFENGLPLVGAVDDSLSGRVVTVTGTETPDREALIVSRIEPHTAFPYHPFLVEAASRYTRSHYGCKVAWNKRFSWKLRAGVGWLGVRMTNTHQPGENKPFIELWFNGENGLFIKALSALGGTSPCR